MGDVSGIRLEHVSAGYRGKTVIKDISLFIPAGKTVLILGENGCGKSTLLKAIAGLLSYEGSITADGAEIKKMTPIERAGKIAMLSQLNGAYFSYTVEETVRMGRYRFHKGLFGGVSEEDIAKTEEYLRKMEIYDIRHERIGELSGGQLQRVYMAQLYAQEADYVFLDEPTNHLDLKYRVALEKDLKESGRSVLAVFHELIPAFSVADEIILMKSGQIVQTGTPKEIRHSEVLNEVFDMDVQSYLSRQSEE